MYFSVPSSCTFRSHSSSHLRVPLSLKAYSVEELKEFSCPRLSPDDFLRLFDASSILIIDIRTQQE